MSKSDKIQTIVLFVVGLGLVGVLLYGIHIKNQYPITKVYEDGSFSGCMKGGLCND